MLNHSIYKLSDQFPLKKLMAQFTIIRIGYKNFQDDWILRFENDFGWSHPKKN